MELLTLLQKGVVLGQTLQSQLIRNLDVLRSRQIALLELADFYRVGGTEQTNLAVLMKHLKNLLDALLELSRNQSVHFVKDD